MTEKKFSNEEIIEAIIKKFGSVEKLADQLGVARANIYQKIGRQSTKFLAELESLGIQLPSKSEDDSLRKIKEKLNAFDLVEVPVYASVKAGDAAPVFETNPVDFIYLPKNGKGRFGVIVDGDSMSNVINHGDIIVVDPELEAINKDVCLIALDDDMKYTLKQVFIDGDTFVLKPANSMFKEITVNKSQIKQCFPVVGHYRNRNQIRMS